MCTAKFLTFLFHHVQFQFIHQPAEIYVVWKWMRKKHTPKIRFWGGNLARFHGISPWKIDQRTFLIGDMVGGPRRVLNFISYICCAFLFCLSVIFNGFYGWSWAFTYNVIPMIHRQCLHTTAILAAIRNNFKCQNACTLHTVHTYTSEYSVGLEKLYAETDETKALFSH